MTPAGRHFSAKRQNTYAISRFKMAHCVTDIFRGRASMKTADSLFLTMRAITPNSSLLTSRLRIARRLAIQRAALIWPYGTHLIATHAVARPSRRYRTTSRRRYSRARVEERHDVTRIWLRCHCSEYYFVDYFDYRKFRHATCTYHWSDAITSSLAMPEPREQRFDLCYFQTDAAARSQHYERGASSMTTRAISSCYPSPQIELISALIAGRFPRL